MATKTKTVNVSLDDGLLCANEVRGHEVLSDEPEGVGGTDKGPTPTELLLAGLGSCVAMTLRMYAKQKDWPLAGVDVELTHERVKRDEAEDWPEGEERKKIFRIERKIRIRGDLDESQVERLRYIARRCPVHRTITENPHVIDDVALSE
jgi:putative redox protein